jgi:hypothetical protein
MRFPKIAAMALAGAITISLGGAGSPPTFKNCTVLNVAYPNGVAKTAKAATHPSPAWVKIKPPVVDAVVYAANKKMDRDQDGIACEVGR